MMDMKVGIKRLKKIVLVPNVNRTHSNGDMTLKFPIESAEEVPYIIPMMGAKDKMMIVVKAVKILAISNLSTIILII
jgi:hypothetical protein